jgi:manganese/zinc/iron transport system substrate-binding protein
MGIQRLTVLATAVVLTTTSLVTAALNVVTTTGMIGDVARHVAGDHAVVTSLMGEGVDPHLYTPRASDVRRILAADLVLYNGLMLEGRMEDLFKRAAAKGRRVHAVAEGLDTSYLLANADQPGHPDPHVWMDVKAWGLVTLEIAKAFCQADPEHCESYERNAKAYVEQLQVLDTFMRDALQSVPKAHRVLVTAHDAFNYFGRAYDVEVLGIQGVSTESEAGIADINTLVDLLVDRRIPAVFVESSVPDKYVRALIEGAASRGHVVIVGGELFSDAMGKPGTHEGTYVGMMAHNGSTIAKGLGGHVPMVAGVNAPESPTP